MIASWTARSLALLAALVFAGEAAAARPNILFILADDLDVATIRAGFPELERLHREGVSFTSAYATSPLCAPSRATILTGRYPQNTGVRSNGAASGGYETFFRNGMEAQTFAGWLRQAGYRTALLGKYINRYPRASGDAAHVPPGWDLWVAPDRDFSIHRKYGYTLNENGRLIAYGSTDEDYLVDVLTRKAQAFIDEAREAGQPFAAVLSLSSPHTPFQAEAAYRNLFADRLAPRPPSFNEADISDKPPLGRRPLLTAAQVQEIDAGHVGRLRLMASVDEMLGTLRAHLAVRGILGNTYLVFASDNGYHQGEHRWTPGKARPYEEDIRIPLLAQGPGLRPGSTVDRLVTNADLAPTFAAWAGASTPPDLDGRALQPLLAAEDAALVPWRRRLPIMRSVDQLPPQSPWPVPSRREGLAIGYACLEHLPPPTTGNVEFRGQRDERYTYVEYATGDLELYDNQRDPYQITNGICSVPASAFAFLHLQTSALATCRGAVCRFWEDMP